MKKFLLSLVALLGVLNAQAAWEKVTSISVGDVVVLAFDNSSVAKELSGVTTTGTTIGSVSDYTTTPEGLYPLTVVEGSQDGTFAFKTTEDTYLAWSSGNSLATAEEVADASSWTVDFTDAGAADIYNVGTTARKLQYNSKSPRFACYGNSGQEAPYLWKQVAGEGVAKPVLPVSTSFLGSMEVAITAEEGATIYYTLDGTDPTTASAVYSEALTITETTTVKAIAAKGETVSSVASATFTKKPSSSTIAELTALENNATFVFTGEALVVAKPTAKYVYITDETGASMIYDASGEKTAAVEVGKTIAANWTGKVTIYNKLFELVPDEALDPKEGEAVEVAYAEVTVADLTADNVNKVVTLKNITGYTINKKNLTITIGEDAVVGYNQFGLEIAAAEEGKTYEMVGAISRFNDKIQFQPITIVEQAAEPEPEPVDNFAVNGDFSAATIIDNHICTYEKDMETNGTTFSRMQEVASWTIAVENSDARAAGVMAYGAETWIGGAGYAAPAFNPAGLVEGQGLGIVAVWGAAAQYTQAVALPAGYYLVSARINNVGGTTATAANFFGAKVGETTYYAENKAYAVGVWTRENVTFQVEVAAEGVISVGYQASNAGNAAQQHLFYDGIVVKVFETEEARAAFIEEQAGADATDAAAYAIAVARKNKLAELEGLSRGDGLFQYSDAAVVEALGALAAAKTVEAIVAIKVEQNLPDAEKQYSFQLKDGGNYMVIDNGIKLAAEAKGFSFVPDNGGGYAIKDGESYVACIGTGDNNWSMGATAEPYAWVITYLADGYYTIAKASKTTEYIGVDNVEAGSPCYANKAVSDKAVWTIAEYVAPTVYTVSIAEDIVNGTVEANPTSAEAGETITLTATPAEGYEFVSFSVNGAETDLLVLVAEDGTFVMPEANVVVSATFQEVPTADYTSYIANADLTGEGGFDATGTKGIDGSGIVKVGNAASFDFKQTIENLPAGKYKVTAQAAYRYGENEQAEYDAMQTDAITKFVQLYATVGTKTESQLVQNRYDGASETDLAGEGTATVNGLFVPNSSNAVKAWFVAGKYVNEVVFNLPADGAVTIGVKRIGTPVSDYTVIGPWTLTRIGDAEAEPEPETLKPGDDATSFIVNPSFETGDLTGWTVGASADTGVKPNSNATYTTEGCDGDYLFNTWWQGIPITQTIVGLPNGLYELKALMTNDAITAGNQPCLYLLANGQHSEAFSAPNAGVFAEGSITFYVTDGTATIGAIAGNADGTFTEAGYYWYKVDNFRLTYKEALPAIEDIEIPTGKMSNDAAKAVADAKEAGDVVALIQAVEAAKASIEAYAATAEAIAAAKVIKEGTNVATADAATTFAAAIEAIETPYNEGTLSDEDAKAAGATLGTIKTGWREGANGAAVKFMESAYGLNGFDGALYVNTWSDEGIYDGTNFLVPFYEYFTDDANALEARTFTTTVEGLEAGIYDAKVWVRVQMKADETVPTGITVSANDGTPVEALGEEATSKNMYLKEVTARAIVGEDGILKIHVNVEEGNNIHWLSFKNVQYVKRDAVEVAYEDALAAIEDGKTYRVFTVQNGTKYLLTSAGKLTVDPQKAATFTFNAVKAAGTLYETGWNLGCKFTNPSLSNGSTGDVVQKGGINVGGNDRDDWERQVFFKNAEGKFAVRATNANSANWGANTYWDFVEYETLPAAGYSLTPSYVWEIEPNVDLRPEAFAKVQTWLTKLQAVEGLVTEGSQWISNAKDPSEGSYAALVDGDYTTFFHSTWHASNDPGADHYLQAELPEATSDFYFYFKKRSQNNNNRPTTIVVAGSNDGETFTEITTISEGLPVGAAPLDYISGKLTAAEAYKYIRFTVPTTSTGQKTGDHVYFTASEWYILPGNGLTGEAAPYMKVADYTDLTEADVEKINLIDEKIAAAKAQIDLAADLADLQATIEKTEALVAACTADEEATTAINTVIATAKESSYTTAEQVADAKATLIAAGKAFVDVAVPVETLDVTAYYIVNAPAITKTGWEGTDFGTASDGVCEYWNKSAADFHQTISLPAGSYILTGIALTRTGMQGKIYAGENETSIVTVGNDVANSRSQAANWFNAGNGRNEVPFTLAEGAEVVIGLTADAATGDHWTVWQGFTLTKVNPAIIEAKERELALAALVAALEAIKPVAENTFVDGVFQPTAEAQEALYDAYATQLAASQNAEATSADLKAALVALNEAKSTYDATPLVAPKTDVPYSFQLKDTEWYLSLNEGVKLSATAGQFYFEAVEGGYALKAGDAYVAMAGSNAWTMSAAEEPYAWVISVMPDGCYTIAKAANKAQLVGANLNEELAEGTSCWGDKSAATGLVSWILAEVADPDAISTVKQNVEGAVIYDLFGRKVEKVQKGGIYIVNGKKVSVK